MNLEGPRDRDKNMLKVFFFDFEMRKFISKYYYATKEHVYTSKIIKKIQMWTAVKCT